MKSITHVWASAASARRAAETSKDPCEALRLPCPDPRGPPSMRPCCSSLAPHPPCACALISLQNRSTSCMFIDAYITKFVSDTEHQDVSKQWKNRMGFYFIYFLPNFAFIFCDKIAFRGIFYSFIRFDTCVTCAEMWFISPNKSNNAPLEVLIIPPRINFPVRVRGISIQKKS
jgi:hypothetical protein